MSQRQQTAFNLITVVFMGLTVMSGVLTLALASGALRPPEFMTKTDPIPPTLFKPVMVADENAGLPMNETVTAIVSDTPSAEPLDMAEAPLSDGTPAANTETVPVTEVNSGLDPARVQADAVEEQQPAAGVQGPAGSTAPPDIETPVPAAPDGRETLQVAVESGPVVVTAPPTVAAVQPEQVPPTAAGQPPVASQATPLPTGNGSPPGGRPSPLRVMVPTDETARHLRQQGMTSIADLSPNIDPALSFSPGPRLNLRSRRPAGDMFPQAFPGSPFKVLAILVEFSDKPSTVNANFFDSLVFSTTPGEQSLANFYSEASYGQLDIVTVNLPSTMDWLIAPQPYSYYVNGQYCMGSYPRNCQKLAEDLVTQVAALPEVYLPDYDNNGDGWLDTFFIIHTGSGAEMSHNPNDVWSHSWWINNNGYPFMVENVFVGSYTTEPEYWFSASSSDTDMTHGVYVHEFGHALGLPDLYDIDGSSEGVGDWSLMSGGSWNGFRGDSPAHLDAWSRSYLEFNPVNNITAFNGLINLPNIQENRFGSLFRIDSGRAGEYWLLENRQQTGSDASLPGSGLLIWHVDNNLVDANNQFECKLVNNYLCNGTATRHFRVALEQADGLRDLEYNRGQGDSGDPYPGDSNNVYFNFKTNPNTSSYYFPQSPNIEVCGISPSASTMSATVSPYTLGLLSPNSGWKTNDNTPDFVWSGLACAASYEIQVDNNSDFLTPAHNHATGATSFTPPALPDGTYYWRVRKIYASGTPGLWTTARTVTIDSALPAVPRLYTPLDHTYTMDRTPTFTWLAATGAASYRLQVSDDYTFAALPLVDISKSGLTHTAPYASRLKYGVYYWRVKALDAAGNESDWSAVRTLTLTILSAPRNAQHLTDTTPTFQVAYVTATAYYHIQVDELDPVDGDFTSPVFNYEGFSRSATPMLPTWPPLVPGHYQWRAQVDTGAGWTGEWTPIWTFTITPPTTVAPALISPLHLEVLDTSTPIFSWQSVPGGEKYQIQIARGDAFLSPVRDQTLSPGELSYTAAPPLSDGGLYYWRVRAINSVGVAGAWSVKRQFTLTQLPRPVLSSPVHGSATNINTPTFGWGGVAGADHYRIQIDNNQNFSSPEQEEPLVPGPSYTPPAPLADGLYYWRVRAVSASGVGGLWSAARTLTIDTTGPVAPRLVAPANLAGTLDRTPTFTWTISAGATRYELQVATDDSFAIDKIVAEASPLTYTYTLPLLDALQDYGVYHWRVSALDKLGNQGDWSTPFSFAISNMLTPKDGAVTAESSPLFQWAAVTGATDYQLQLDDNEAFSHPMIAQTGLVRYHRFGTSLDPGVYYWKVCVDTGAGCDLWMPAWSFTITPARPGTPVLVSPANAALTNDRTPELSWQAAKNGSTYQVQIDNNGDFRSPEQDVTVGTGLLTYLASDLNDGLHYWRVRAINSDGAPGYWTLARNFTVDTTAPPAPVLVTPIDGASSTNRMLRLDWNPSAGAARYELWLDQDLGFPLPPIAVGVSTEYTPPMPLSRGTYFWRVAGVDKAGNVSDFSEPSRSFAIVAGITAPQFPTGTPTVTETPTPELTETVTPTETAIPTATAEPPVVPPTPTPTGAAAVVSLPLVSLPFVDAFDIEIGWQPAGAWRFAGEAGYRGGAWFADSALRGSSSILTASYLIDLRAAQQPELRFWQRLDLSSGDVSAVDITTDGGQTWIPLDQQIGRAADWHEQVIGLTPYRGFVIQLRFRLDTLGSVPQDEQSYGWWIDELVVHEAPGIPPTPVPPTATPTETPVPTEVPTQPTEIPTQVPVEVPTEAPTGVPTDAPPTLEPTAELPPTAPPDSVQ